MKTYTDFLAAHPNGVMATVADKQPQTRVFQYLWAEGTKLYFCTANTKDVYKQMVQNPLVSFCTWDPQSFTTLSVQGRVHFVDDLMKKERVLAENPPIRGLYKSAANPEFTMLYLEAAEIKSFSFSEGTQHTRLG